MIAKLQISDFHLGDPRSTLGNPDVAAEVVRQIARISGGQIGKLIVAGDAHEECVPGGLNRLHDGVAVSVLEASRGFFGLLYDEVDVGETVVVPGNHDLCTWVWYCDQTRSDYVTTYTGRQVDPAAWPWRHLYPGTNVLTFGYPIYWDESPGSADDYPIHVVTHGHLMDPLVLGWDPEYEYAALAALGCERPQVSRSDNPLLSQLGTVTRRFVTGLWSRYSPRDYAYANYVMRRLVHPQSCAYQRLPGLPGDYYDLSYPGQNLDFPSRDAAPAGQDYVMGNLPWFLDCILTDPRLPSPVGSLRQGNPAPAALTKPSCLTRGHDHLGTFRTVVAGGVPWVDASSGGWTSEFDGHLPHAHSLVWKEPGQIVPEVYFHRARTKSGSLL